MAVGGYVHGATRRRTPLDDLQDQISALATRVEHLNTALDERDQRITRLEERCTYLLRKTPGHVERAVKSTTTKPAMTGRRTYPADRAKEHISALNESGWKMREIAEASGVSLPVIVGINTGKRPTVSPRIESFILALRPRRKTP